MLTIFIAKHVARTSHLEEKNLYELNLVCILIHIICVIKYLKLSAKTRHYLFFHKTFISIVKLPLAIESEKKKKNT